MTDDLARRLARLPRGGVAAVAVLVLIWLNVYVCRELFHLEYSSYTGSIEAAYISISNYILRHGFSLDWFPLWYCGIPFQNSYPPFLHATVALAALILQVSPALAYHILGGVFYCLGSISVYLLVVRLTSNRLAAFSAGLLYSVLCPSTFLSSTVGNWTASFRDPARLFSIMKFGDAPHATALMLLPLAILALDWAVSRPTVARIFLCSVSCAAVVLTNWLGAFALAVAVVSYLLASAAGPRRFWQPVRVLSVSAVLAYALAAPFIPPSTIGRIEYNAQYVIGRYEMRVYHVLYVLPVILVVALVFWALRRFRASIFTGFTCLFALISTSIVVAAEWFGVSIVPQPHRYHLEIDLAVDLMLVAFAIVLWRRLPQRLTPALLLVLAVALGLQVKHVRHAARGVMGSTQESDMIEPKLATWLRDNVGEKRIFTSGSTQFWLNAFTDTPQIGGGFGQGIVNPQIPIVHYGIPWTERDGADTAVWLRLYGSSAVVVSEPDSKDAYPEVWRDPNKFKGILPELFRTGGDVIYGVPQRSYSLAHVIGPRDGAWRRPVNDVDFDPVRALAAAMENPNLPVARFQWVSKSVAEIHARMSPEQLLFVQVTYHPGWHAENNGRRIALREDGLGFMLLEPKCEGECDVKLIYDGGLEMRLAKIASVTALLIGCAGIGRAALMLWQGRS